MKPEMVYPIDNSKYVYAYCQCQKIIQSKGDLDD